MLNGECPWSPPVKRVVPAPCNSPWGHQLNVPSAALQHPRQGVPHGRPREARQRCHDNSTRTVLWAKATRRRAHATC